MNMEKMTQWLELARQCSHDGFWDGLGESSSASEDKGKPEPAEAWSPPVNLYRAELQAWIWVELPGVRKEELDISFSGQTVKIKGTKTDRMLIKDIPITECFHGPFERKVDVPFPVDWSTASAKLSEGVLLIRFALQAESETRIPVE